MYLRLFSLIAHSRNWIWAFETNINLSKFSSDFATDSPFSLSLGGFLTLFPTFYRSHSIFFCFFFSFSRSSFSWNIFITQHRKKNSPKTRSIQKCFRNFNMSAFKLVKCSHLICETHTAIAFFRLLPFLFIYTIFVTLLIFIILLGGCLWFFHSLSIANATRVLAKTSPNFDVCVCFFCVVSYPFQPRPRSEI